MLALTGFHNWFKSPIHKWLQIVHDRSCDRICKAVEMDKVILIGPSPILVVYCANKKDISVWGGQLWDRKSIAVVSVDVFPAQLEPVRQEKHSSSAVEVIACFGQVRKIWLQLAWPDSAGAFIFITRLTDVSSTAGARTHTFAAGRPGLDLICICGARRISAARPSATQR